jgi:hypothetical protein
MLNAGTIAVDALSMRFSLLYPELALEVDAAALLAAVPLIVMLILLMTAETGWKPELMALPPIGAHGELKDD